MIWLPVVTFLALTGLFSLVMFDATVEASIGDLLGISKDKTLILSHLGIGMGGTLVALQAIASYKRVAAMEETAQAQAGAALAQARASEELARANVHTEQGQRQERLKSAIEHLGHPSESVRLGGAYELFHLAEDSSHLAQTVLEILCAHIRRTTGEPSYRELFPDKPSVEIQSLVTLLFVQRRDVFWDCDVHLRGSWLAGAELSDAYLHRTDVSNAYLHGAILRDAHLPGAVFMQTEMQGVLLVRAVLDGSSLYKANLHLANLESALLRGSDLLDAAMHGANLNSARVQGSVVGGLQLQGAELSNADFRGVQCRENVSYQFDQRINESAGQETDVSSVVFRGGLTHVDLEAITGAASEQHSQHLLNKLGEQVGEPVSYERSNDIIVGSYTMAEAEAWKSEYTEALKEPSGAVK